MQGDYIWEVPSQGKLDTVHSDSESFGGVINHDNFLNKLGGGVTVL